jgi:hypothetical protein
MEPMTGPTTATVATATADPRTAPAAARPTPTRSVGRFASAEAHPTTGATTIVQLPLAAALYTLDYMSDSWLDRGHGPDPSYLDTIFTSAARDLRPRISDTLATAEQQTALATGGGSSRRSSRLLVMIALWLGIIAGTSGAAWAVRDALFPSIGSSEVSVWQNPGHQTEPTITDGSSSTSSTTSTPTAEPGTAVPPTDDTSTVSVESDGSNGESDNSVSSGPGRDDSVPVDPIVTASSEHTSSSIDDHGGDGGGGSGSGDGAGSNSGDGGGSNSGGGGG